MKLIVYRLSPEFFTLKETRPVEPLFFVEFQLDQDRVYRVTRSKGGRLAFFTQSEMEGYIRAFSDVVRMQGVEILYRNGEDYYTEDGD